MRGARFFVSRSHVQMLSWRGTVNKMANDRQPVGSSRLLIWSCQVPSLISAWLLLQQARYKSVRADKGEESFLLR